MLLNNASGFQIGIEAKLSLNAKLLSQLVDRPEWSALRPGPDFRAALVPFGSAVTLYGIAEQLGLAVIQMHDAGSHAAFATGKRRTPGLYSPDLPIIDAAPTSHALNPKGSTKRALSWPEWCPVERLVLPEIVPNLPAGVAAPKRMTAWKIKAIRLGVLLDRRGWINRHDFARLALSMTYWTREKLIVNAARGRWIATEHFPDFAAQFPEEWAHYSATIEKWAAPKEVGGKPWTWAEGVN